MTYDMISELLILREKKHPLAWVLFFSQTTKEILIFSGVASSRVQTLLMPIKHTLSALELVK